MLFRHQEIVKNQNALGVTFLNTRVQLATYAPTLTTKKPKGKKNVLHFFYKIARGNNHIMYYV